MTTPNGNIIAIVKVRITDGKGCDGLAAGRNGLEQEDMGL